VNVTIPDRLIQTIEQGSVFCLLSHSEPDGDCLGSELALGRFLERIGKTVHLYSPGPFGRPEIRFLEPRFESRIDKSVLAENPVVVILDCSTLDRIGELAEDIADLPSVIVIDHHSSGEPFGTIHHVDTSAPSVTLLIQDLIEKMGYTVDSEEAKWILFGFCTDTGFFRHLDSTEAGVFEAVGRLTAAGATPKQIYGMIFGNKALAARILLGTIMSRTESLFDDRVLLTYETLEDKVAYGAINRDSDALYQHLQTVKGCEAVIFIREEDERTCSVGLRSNNSLDVGAIAKSFGGGGHKRAAGFTWVGDRDEITHRIAARFADILGKSDL